MKRIVLMLAATLAFGPLANADSGSKEILREVRQESTRLAKAIYASNPAELKGVKFSKPSIKDNKDGTYSSEVIVESVNGEPVAGGEWFDFSFFGPVLQSATHTCKFCYEP